MDIIRHETDVSSSGGRKKYKKSLLTISLKVPKYQHFSYNHKKKTSVCSLMLLFRWFLCSPLMNISSGGLFDRKREGEKKRKVYVL